MKQSMATAVLCTMMVLSSSNIQAASPASSPPEDPREAFAGSDVVFQAKVERVFQDGHGYDSSADVRVQRIWKGRQYLHPLARIHGTGGPTYPARIFFTVGQVYLFYLPANAQGKGLHADSFLHRVVPKDASTGDLKFLSGMKSSTP
jgi:hypothetical protein